MSDRPAWHGTPTRLPDGEWGVLIRHFPPTFPPRPGETVKVQTRRRGHWKATITAIEDTSRQTVVRTTGPAEALEHDEVRDTEPQQLTASEEDNPLGTLRETAETLYAAAAALREAQVDSEQSYRKVLSALYYAEDDQGNNLMEAHQILCFSFPNRNASDHALYGAARLLEAATDTLFGAKDLLEEVSWMDDFGEVDAARTLRTAIARLDTAGLLEAAGGAICVATALLAVPNNPNSAALNQEHREGLVTLQQICNALRRALRDARPDEP